jgi:hypothetical protein
MADEWFRRALLRNVATQLSSITAGDGRRFTRISMLWLSMRAIASTRWCSLIPGVVVETVRNGNHFLPLDRPEVLRDLIARFAAI